MRNVDIDIKRIEFSITKACTGKCKHCQIGSLESTGEGINAEAAVNAIKRITSKYKVDSLMTFGGEPLLYADTVCKIHSVARDCGIASRTIITNGFFTRNKEKIESVAKSLSASGVESIALSVDAFHQEYIPFEPVIHFAKSLLENGFSNLKTHPAWLVNREHDNKYNNETKHLLKIFEEMGIESSKGNNIFPAGNANKYLSEYFPPNKEMDLSASCGHMPYTSRLDEVRCIGIEPNGDINKCFLKMGNIYEDDVLDMLDSYNPYSSPEAQIIMESGISGLLEHARKSGVTVDISDCHSPCVVCEKIMSALKEIK